MLNSAKVPSQETLREALVCYRGENKVERG